MRWPERSQWLLAAPFALLGLWCALGWAQQRELQCTRDADQRAWCTLTRASLLTNEQLGFDAAALASAEIEVHTSADADGSVSSWRRLIFRLDASTQPLGSFGEAGIDQALSEIRDFNASRGPSTLRLGSDNRRYAYPMALLWLGFGAWILLRRDA